MTKWCELLGDSSTPFHFAQNDSAGCEMKDWFYFQSLGSILIDFKLWEEIFLFFIKKKEDLRW
jgi:hypothetical protein